MGKASRNKKERRAERGLEDDVVYYFVETSAGNCILPGSSDVFVNLVGDNYVPKTVADLSEGESVSYKKECIDKTLEEVEQHLCKSPRYDAADKALHKWYGGPAKTRKIPRFRHDLVRSLIETGLVSLPRANLERKLFQVGSADFTLEERQEMVAQIRKILERDEEFKQLYKESTRNETIGEWLKGKNIALKHWQVFDILGRSFERFESYNKPREEGGLRDDFKLYKTIRSEIMSYLASKGKRKTNIRARVKSNSANAISLAPEIEIVLAEFIDDKSEVCCDARVNSIRPLAKKEDRSQRGKSDPKTKLKKGIVTEQMPEEGHEYLNVANAAGELALVGRCLRFALCTYMNRNPDHPYAKLLDYIDTPEEKKRFNVVFSTEVLNGLSLINGLKTTDGPVYEHDGYAEDVSEKFVEVSNEFYEEILNGKVDRELKLPENTMYNALRAFLRISKAIPIEIIKAVKAQDDPKYESDRKFRRQAKRRIAAVGKKYFSGRDLDQRKGFVFDNIVDTRNNSDAHLREIDQLLMDPDYVKNNRKAQIKQYGKGRFYGRLEVMQALDRYDIGSIMRFLPAAAFLE